MEIDLDLKNVYTFTSRDKAEEELESDVIYHYFLEVFRSLYGKTVTPQCNYGDGPHRPPISVHRSIDGFGRGVAPASIYLNILAARIYRKELATRNGRRVLFTIVDDVKIAAPPADIAEIVDSLAEVACQVARLITQMIKNRIYVQPSVRSGWTEFLESTPRNPIALLPIHDIPEGSLSSDPSDPDGARHWPDDNGINVLGTPLGTQEFIESYLDGKGIKHQ